MKFLRWVGYAVAVLAGIAVIAALIVYLMSERVLAHSPKPQPLHLAKPTAAQLPQGQHLLRVLGCQGCHGAKLEGQNFIDDAMLAKLYAPNLTALATNATDAQLDRAIRQGIGVDGRALIIMPSQSYQFLSDAEAGAIIAAVRAMPKTGHQQPARSVGPIGRVGLVTGKFFTIPQLAAKYRAAPLPDFGPSFARGRHLVETKCSECHGADLKGQELEPGVVSSDLAIVGAYDLEQFKTLLRTGVPPSKKKLGLMAEVSRLDFSHYNDDEIAAIHAYLVERANRQP